MARFFSAVSCTVFALLLPFPIVLAQQKSKPLTPSMPRAAQQNQAEPPKGKLYWVQVEDADEAALIEQELKIKPQLVRDGRFYYYGDQPTNTRLIEIGYEPVSVDPQEVFFRLVRVVRKGSEQTLRDLGAVIVLRERGYWIVRANSRQLRLLTRLGYVVQPLGKQEPRPRQVSISVSNESDVAAVGGLRVDIYSVRKDPSGFVIYGGAFDDAIDDLRAHGFKVKIEPDPPGVTR
jgi:hypothetical protein